MKKLLLFGFVLGLVMAGYGQKRILLDQELANRAVKAVHQEAISDLGGFENQVNAAVSHGRYAFDETEIGKSWYDLQTNTSLGNRIWLFPDGTVSAVWTMGFESTAFPDRGTGYNYFDGTAWGPQPTARIETEKTGWPCIAAWGENGEINAAHTGAAQGLLFNKRATKGTGAWEASYLVGPDASNPLVWPRIMTAGVNNSTIHLLVPSGNATTYGGMTPALLYSKSTDGTATWDPVNTILPGMGPDYYLSLSADEYTWAEPRNGVIAFQVVDAWHDWFVMKSTDDG
ncbi:MAG: hypothetical protein JW861_14140, partial [Bacteroidales bacterium]|nr:hypothetical protein [Bacteroidales bacterium]